MNLFHPCGKHSYVVSSNAYIGSLYTNTIYHLIDTDFQQKSHIGNSSLYSLSNYLIILK